MASQEPVYLHPHSDPYEVLRRCGGVALADRMQWLDSGCAAPAATSSGAAPAAPKKDDSVDYDVVLLGGGLSLLVAPLLAAQGLRVLVCDRQRVGLPQREWNASFPELQKLVASGFCSEAELLSLIVARYHHGICRWHGGGSYPVQHVLDCAVDAEHLLTLARQRAEKMGVDLVEQQSAVALAAGPQSVRVRLSQGAQLTARVVLDGRGAASPFATTDLVCPTVGGVIEGLRQGPGPTEYNPRIGEILVTTEGVDAGHQHLWEGFPGRPGQLTVYLFYYARRHAVSPGALQRLYGRFFAKLHTYKQGTPRLLRPTFGFIPGWSRLGPGPSSGHPRVVLMGDAAARHSPLTFCGFGAMLRSLEGVVRHVTALAGAQLDQPLGVAVDDTPLHTGTGALALMLATPRMAAPDALNGLLDAAFAALHSLGNHSFAALLQDTMPLQDFVRFLHRTSSRRPKVYGDVWRSLGPRTCGRWAWSVAKLLRPLGRQTLGVNLEGPKTVAWQPPTAALVDCAAAAPETKVR